MVLFTQGREGEGVDKRCEQVSFFFFSCRDGGAVEGA